RSAALAGAVQGRPAGNLCAGDSARVSDARRRDSRCGRTRPDYGTGSLIGIDANTFRDGSASDGFCGFPRLPFGPGGNCNMSEVLDVISVAPVAEPHWAEAIRFLEQAVKAGNQDPNGLYMLAMAYKHQGRTGEAQQILAKIPDPDANVLLQRGVLAFNVREWANAGGDFEKAWQKEAASYPAAYNLMLTRLCQ